MYSIVGAYVNGSSFCDECIVKELEDELTTDEIRFLMHGHDDPYMKTMREWPVRVKAGERFYEHVWTDGEHGDIITDDNVKVTSNDWIHTWKSENEFFNLSDGDESENGEYCDKCSKEIVEPFHVECHECRRRVIEGSETRTLENAYHYDEAYCRECHSKELEDLLERVEARILPLSSLDNMVTYWQVEAFRQALKTMYIRDVIAYYEQQVLSVTDVEQNVVLAQCLDILKDELDCDSLEYEKTKLPAWAFVLQLNNEPIYESEGARQLAPVPSKTRVWFDTGNPSEYQQQALGL
jgi:hypothetical protein